MASKLRAYLSRSAMDLHDDWNLVVIGALNIAHMGYWCGAFALSPSMSFLFYADAAYLLLDSLWLVLAPSCVPPKSWKTLLMHHALVCTLLPITAGRPVMMKHLVRVWAVEVHSWNHIATRRFGGTRLASVLEAANKPLFIGLRLINFPYTYFQFAADRAALPIALRATESPEWLMVPLGVAHSIMYALMIKWGYGLLVAPWLTRRPALDTSGKQE